MFYLGNKVKMTKAVIGAVKSKGKFVGQKGVVTARIKHGDKIMFGVSIRGVRTGYMWDRSELHFIDFK